MIHIWLPNPQAPLRVWQPTTQSWQTAENWQEVATLVSLQAGTKAVAKSKQVCLYFPSINLLTVQPNLPASQIKALGEAGRRYLFEDISIGSVEDLQVKIDSSPMPSLYALHDSEREQWDNAVSLAGLNLVAVLPDFVLLPTDVLPKNLPITSPVTEETQPTHTDNAVFYQDNATQLMAFPQANSPAVTGMAVTHLPMVLVKIPQLSTLYLAKNAFADETNYPQAGLQDFPNLHLITTDVSPRPLAEPTRHFFNFAVKKAESNVPAYAKIIGMVLLSAAIFAIIVDGLRLYYYQKAVTQTKTAIAMQYNQWFPNEKYNPQLNMQRQLQSKLMNNQATDNKVLATLSSIQPVFQQYQITAKNLNYQGQNLQLNVVAKDADSLNKAVNQLVGQGVNAKLGSVSAGVISNGAVANTAGNAMASTPTGTVTNPTIATTMGNSANTATIEIAL